MHDNSIIPSGKPVCTRLRRINAVCLIWPPWRISLFTSCSDFLPLSSPRVNQRDSFGSELVGDLPIRGPAGSVHDAVLLLMTCSSDSRRPKQGALKSLSLMIYTYKVVSKQVCCCHFSWGGGCIRECAIDKGFLIHRLPGGGKPQSRLQNHDIMCQTQP